MNILKKYEAVARKYNAKKNQWRNQEFFVFAAGHAESRLYVRPFSQCGPVADGISFRHGDQGGWVVSFEDIKKIYFAALEFRELK